MSQETGRSRPATAKQLDYIRGLRKKLYDVFGSQTPKEFLDRAADDLLSVAGATILISEMRRMQESGAPPVRQPAGVEPSNFDPSGYESELVLPFPLDGKSYIRVWVKWPSRDDPWAWLCFHPDHVDEVESSSGAESKRSARAGAEAHWREVHGDDFPEE